MAHPHSQPLPDLCLIAIFKQLSPNDQLTAAEISARCAALVRAANRHQAMLVITDWSDLERTRDKVNVFSLGTKPSMRLLESAEMYSSSDYPQSAIPISKWNCLLLNRHQGLQLDSPATIAAIAYLFPAISDLKFIACNSNQCERLVDLLLQPHCTWAGQLTSLLVTNFYSDTADLAHRLIGVINDRLLALLHLAIHWDSDVPLPEMTVLARLKVLSIRCWPRHLASFHHSLERFGAKNDHLVLHLLPFSDGANGLYGRALDQHFDQPAHCRQIVRYGWDPLHYTADTVALLCERFPRLSSLSIFRITPFQVGPLFVTLSPMRRLVHLQLAVSFEKTGNEGQVEEEESLPEPPTAQSHSLRALDLELVVSSHSQLQWLNLPATLPHLQAIHLKDFQCRACRVNLRDFLKGRYVEDGAKVPSASTARGCLRATLTQLHSGVHHRRIILGFAAQNGSYSSLEQLLLANQ